MVIQSCNAILQSANFKMLQVIAQVDDCETITAKEGNCRAQPRTTSQIFFSVSSPTWSDPKLVRSAVCLLVACVVVVVVGIVVVVLEPVCAILWRTLVVP